MRIINNLVLFSDPIGACPQIDLKDVPSKAAQKCELEKGGRQVSSLRCNELLNKKNKLVSSDFRADELERTCKKASLTKQNFFPSLKFVHHLVVAMRRMEPDC